MAPETRSQRSGRYEPQAQGYRAFIPAPLPPNPPLDLTVGLTGLLAEAEQAVGRLDGSTQILPSQKLFVAMYVRKEAVLSSQIEGTQSSLDDLLAAEARMLRSRQPDDVGEVVNYVAALNHGIARLATLPVSVRLIRELHERLLTGTRGSERQPGHLRESQNWIGAGGAPLSEAIFVPPPHHVVPEALGDLEGFIHEERDLPLLIRIGMAHAQFETIHPFLDGNGRVGRLLITLLLCEQGALQQPVLYLSHYLRQHRSDYYQALQAVREEGAWEDWVAFFLRAVQASAIDATETARRIVDLRERHRDLLVVELGRGAGTGLRLLEALYRRPLIDIPEARELLGVTHQAANNLVTRLQAMSVLEEVTGQARHRVYRYSEYADLFADGTADEAHTQAVLEYGGQ
ncbi:MAG: Fic family protein [Dehalococcoidia bacterium]|nr:Fic family protein [Dehalococcoidia bacterium]